VDKTENKAKLELIVFYLLIRNICLPNNPKKAKYVKGELPSKVLNDGRGKQKSAM